MSGRRESAFALRYAWDNACILWVTSNYLDELRTARRQMVGCTQSLYTALQQKWAGGYTVHDNNENRQVDASDGPGLDVGGKLVIATDQERGKGE